MKEIEFKTIQKAPDYLINANGIVKDKRTNKLVIPKINILGRPSVILNDKNYSLDMLVALNYDIEGEGFIIRYKDNNMNNIKADNLYWYMPTEEELQELEEEIEANDPVKGAYSKQCFVINTDGTLRASYESIIECCDETGYVKTYISKHKGNYFTYINAYIYPEFNQNIVNEIKRKEEIRNFNQIKIENRKTLTHKNNIAYIINTDGTIREEINKYTDLSIKHNTSKQYWRNLSRQESYNARIDGYLIAINDWNEDTKQRILDKENKRNKKRKYPSRMRKVGKYDKEGNLIKIFDGVRQALDEDGAGVQIILREQRYNKKGFIYKYMD